MEESSQNASVFSSVDWTKCVFCQENTSEKRECPANSKQSNRGAGYITLQKDMESFYEAGELQLDLARLVEGEGIADILLKHNASWHKSCRVKYNATKLKRLERKGTPAEGNGLQQPDESGKRTRSDLPSASVGQEVCFFCGGATTEGNPLSWASTMELDSRVRAVAVEVNDFNLLGKLSAGDMVALKSQYHKQCLVALYARTRQQPVVNQVEESTPQRVAFSEIVRKLEDCKVCTSDCKVLKLSDAKREYLTRLQELGAPT